MLDAYAIHESMREGIMKTTSTMKCCEHGAGGGSGEARNKRTRVKVPASFERGMEDLRSGRVYAMGRVFNEKPPSGL
jgi:hypothetical protein